MYKMTTSYQVYVRAVGTRLQYVHEVGNPFGYERSNSTESTKCPRRR